MKPWLHAGPHSWHWLILEIYSGLWHEVLMSHSKGLGYEREV